MVIPLEGVLETFTHLFTIALPDKALAVAPATAEEEAPLAVIVPPIIEDFAPTPITLPATLVTPAPDPEGLNSPEAKPPIPCPIFASPAEKLAVDKLPIPPAIVPAP